MLISEYIAQWQYNNARNAGDIDATSVLARMNAWYSEINMEIESCMSWDTRGKTFADIAYIEFTDNTQLTDKMTKILAVHAYEPKIETRWDVVIKNKKQVLERIGLLNDWRDVEVIDDGDFMTLRDSNWTETRCSKEYLEWVWTITLNYTGVGIKCREVPLDRTIWLDEDWDVINPYTFIVEWNILRSSAEMVHVATVSEASDNLNIQFDVPPNSIQAHIMDTLMHYCTWQNAITCRDPNVMMFKQNYEQSKLNLLTYLSDTYVWTVEYRNPNLRHLMY